MKYISIFAALLMIISCSKDPVIIDNGGIEACTDVLYNESFTMLKGESVCFPDGKSFSLETLSPEYCPCDAICVWEGTMVAIIETTDQNGNMDLINLNANITSVAQEIFEGYGTTNMSAATNDPNVELCNNEHIDTDIASITLTVSPL